MLFYELIRKQLRQSDINYELDEIRKTDIVEYMVLEAAGILAPLQGMALKCIYRAGHTSNIMFDDGIPRSGIELGLKDIEFDWGKPLIDEATERKFHSIVHNAFRDKLDGTYSSESRYYNEYGTLIWYIIPDEKIEKAIKSSSLFIASGDLSALSIDELLMLRKKIGFYKNADSDISAMVDKLTDKITSHSRKRFGEEVLIEKLSSVEKAFSAQQAIDEQQRKFNELFYNLNSKLNELKRKGSQLLLGKKNKDFASEYCEVAVVADTLSASLKQASDTFFNNPPSQHGFAKFEEACTQAINLAKGEFAKFRGAEAWYNDLHPIFQGMLICCKAIAGVLAGITIIPALITEKYAPQGYICTFFRTQTDSLNKLELFEQGMFGKKGIIDELSETIEPKV